MARAAASQQNRIGRPPVVRETIDGDVRRAIVEGRYAPGDQVPSVAELAARYKVSPTTVHEALMGLAADGFVLARGRRGTFVVEFPPHRWRIAIVERYLRPQPHAEYRSLRIEAMEQAAHDLASRDLRRKIEFFYGINEEYDAHDSYHRLVHEVRAQRLAGLVFLEEPTYLRDSELLRLPGVPRVTFGRHFEGAEVVRPDYASWFHRAVDLVATRGRRRIALLANSMNAEAPDHLIAFARQRGIEIPQHWIQFVQYKEIDACRITELLFHPDQKTRPDALLVSDDHYVAGVMKGLAIARMRPAQDVAVVAMFNFPNLARTEQPIDYLGFDQRRAISNAIEIIDSLRRGEKPPVRTIVAQSLDEMTRGNPPLPSPR